MTQPPRTTESLSRDNEAIRDIMHQIRDRLTVPDRATLAVGLVGHLATLMNGRQIEKLMDELAEQAERVQDVPPARRRDREAAVEGETERRAAPARGGDDARMAAPRDAIGQAGRGAVTENSGRML
jgi:hypothetical protein